jgi:hypothetical protein
VAHALDGTSWLSGLYQGHWSGLLLVSIGLVLVLGLLISTVVTPELLQIFLAAIKWMWGLILRAIAFLAGLLPEPEPVELPPIPAPETMPSEEADLSRIFSMPDPLRRGLRIGWALLFFGFILLALWRVSSNIFSWLRRKLTGMAGAEFEPLPGAFSADIINLLKRILSRLLRLRPRFRLRKGQTVTLPELASIRQIYSRLLHWSATGGYPRQMSHTPLEHLYLLSGLVPEAQEDLDFITQHYLAARYGKQLPTEDEIHTLKQRWHRVKQSQLKRAGGKSAG